MKTHISVGVALMLGLVRGTRAEEPPERQPGDNFKAAIKLEYQPGMGDLIRNHAGDPWTDEGGLILLLGDFVEQCIQSTDLECEFKPAHVHEQWSELLPPIQDRMRFNGNATAHLFVDCGVVWIGSRESFAMGSTGIA